MGININYLTIFIFFLLPFVSNAQNNCSPETIAQIVQKTDSLRLEIGDYAAAIDILQSKIDICSSSLENENPADLATLYHKMAVNYFFQEKFSIALEQVNQALQIRQTLGDAIILDFSNSIYLKAIIYRYMGNFTQAKENYVEAIELLESSTSLADIQKVEHLAPKYEDMGILSISVGDFSLALSYLNKAETAYIKHIGTRSDGSVAYVISKKGNVYHSLKDYDKAIVTYNLAINICNEFNPTENLDVAEFLGHIYNDKAFAYSAQEKYDDAEVIYNDALAIFQNLNLNEVQSNTHSNLILTYAHQDNFEATQNSYQQGLALAQEVYKTAFHHKIAELHRNMGEAESLRNNHDTALQYYQTAIKSLVPDFQTNSTFPNPVLSQRVIGPKMELLQTLSRKVKTLQAKHSGNPSDNAPLLVAFQTSQTLDTLITQIRQSYQAQGSKFYLTETVIPVYEQAIATALSLFEQTQDVTYRQAAYNFVARNKAIVLLDGFQEEQARTYANIPANILGEEQSIKQEMSALEQAIYEAQQNEGNVDSLRQILFDWKRQQDRFIKNLENQYPDYYNFKYAFSETILLENLQEQLDDDAALIEYFVGEEKMYTFMLTKDEVKIFEQDIDSEFIPTLQRFRRTISDWAYVQENGAQAEGEFIESAQQLYNWVVRPCLTEPNLSKLTIIPDGALNYVQFGALLSAPIEDWTSISESYLELQYAISYAYSSRLLLDEAANERVAEYLFGGFGLEYDDYTLQALEDMQKDSLKNQFLQEILRGAGLSQLPHAPEEVEQIGEMIQGNVYVNEAVTKPFFLDKANDYHILHIAAHGLVDMNQPENSALVFTKQADSTDFMLRLSEIFNLSLNAHLVVLSMCDTGFGKLKKGEGVMSLARAFQYAGSSSLVATYWSVSSSSMSTIMQLFYKNLKNGDAKDIALQKAKRQFLQSTNPESAKPIYWAAPVMIGDASAIDFGGGMNYLWWGITGGLLLGGLLFLKRKYA